MKEFLQRFHKLEASWLENIQKFETSDGILGIREVVLCLALAGLAGLYLRFLYNRCSRSLSDTDSTGQVFPMLAIVTAAVILVVKSSLALSLGLVGALSIVRFRAAIKEPEELVYLFLCIAVGLCFGAQQMRYAFALVLMVSTFVIPLKCMGSDSPKGKLLVTISGGSDQFQQLESELLPKLQSKGLEFTIQRFDLENEQGQLRVVFAKTTSQQETSLLVTLQQDLPDYQVSLVNLDIL